EAGRLPKGSGGHRTGSANRTVQPAGNGWLDVMGKSGATDGGNASDMSNGANRSGSKLEGVISYYIELSDISFIPQYRTRLRCVMDKLIRVDFNLDELGYYVQVKRQESSGSVDEKAPKLNQDIHECYDRPCVVVVHGEESGPWYRYLKPYESDKMLVMTIGEF